MPLSRANRNAAGGFPVASTQRSGTVRSQQQGASGGIVVHVADAVVVQAERGRHRLLVHVAVLFQLPPWPRFIGQRHGLPGPGTAAVQLEAGRPGGGSDGPIQHFAETMPMQDSAHLLQRVAPACMQPSDCRNSRPGPRWALSVPTGRRFPGDNGATRPASMRPTFKGTARVARGARRLGGCAHGGRQHVLPGYPATCTNPLSNSAAVMA